MVKIVNSTFGFQRLLVGWVGTGHGCEWTLHCNNPAIDRWNPLDQEPKIQFLSHPLHIKLSDSVGSWRKTCYFLSRYSWHWQLHLSSFLLLLPPPSSSPTNHLSPFTSEFPFLPSLFLPITPSSLKPDFQTATFIFCVSHRQQSK